MLWFAASFLACAPSPQPEFTGESVDWPAHPWELTPVPGVRRELAVLDLPWAGEVGLDLRNGALVRAFIVNVEKDGDLYFKGLSFPLDAEHREVAFSQLQQAREATRKADASRGPSTTVLRADYTMRWAVVRDLVIRMRGPAGSPERLSFAVAPPRGETRSDARLDMEPVERAPEDPRAAGLEVKLDLKTPAGASPSSPRVRVDGKALVFSPGDPYQAGPANDLANANWGRFREIARGSHERGMTTARLEIADEVPWAHVAMSLGTLREAGLNRIRIEGLDTYLVSTPPPEASAWRPGDRDRKDLSPARAVALGGALAAVGFAAVWIAARRRRRSPPVESAS